MEVPTGDFGEGDGTSGCGLLAASLNSGLRVDGPAAWAGGGEERAETRGKGGIDKKCTPNRESLKGLMLGKAVAAGSIGAGGVPSLVDAPSGIPLSPRASAT